MTIAENNKYYQKFLVELGLNADQIHYLLNLYPIGKSVVNEKDKKEGTIVESSCYHKGEKVLLLYRTNGAWVGLSSFNKIVTIEGKYFTRGYYKTRMPLEKEQKDFIEQHFPQKSTNNIVNSNASNGEIVVAKALEAIGFAKAFKIIPEYQIPDLIDFEKLWVRSPRYDFAVIGEDGPLMYIEFDGEQHYKGGDSNSLLIFKRDMAKNAYAFYTSTPLIRIPKGILLEQNNVKEVANLIKIYISAGKFMSKLKVTDNNYNLL